MHAFLPVMLVALVLLLVGCAAELPCPCDKADCPSQEDCVTVLDRCNCCRVCVRGVLEQCGGSLGLCSKSLVCITEGGRIAHHNETGICQEVGCVQEDRTYKTGQRWEEGCQRCTCQKNGVIFCQDKKCDVNSACTWLHKSKEECCPVCAGCIRGAKHYKNNATWNEGDCTTCHCMNGTAYCVSQMCETKCSNPVTVPGICCPVCKDSSSRHSCLINSRETRFWHDGCRYCICQNGMELCSLLLCPPVKCHNPITVPGTCCPSCPEEPQNFSLKSFAFCQGLDGHLQKEGDTWWLDKCTYCICVKGQSLCRSSACPPVPCQSPVWTSRDCCPSCPDLKNIDVNQSNCLPCVAEDGNTYMHGHQWKPQACVSCICRAGRAICYKESCQPVTCPQPFFVKNHCCPLCLKPSQGIQNCSYKGKLLSTGEQWIVDECNNCSCFNGTVVCKQQVCSHEACKEIVKIPGKCCPICVASMDSEKASQRNMLIASIILISALLTALMVLSLALYYFRKTGCGVVTPASHFQRNCNLNGYIKAENCALLEHSEVSKKKDVPIIKDAV